MNNYIKLMRPKHYLKNVLIFLPLFFSGTFFDSNSLVVVLLGFIAFCFTASIVYIINDINDKEKDKLHPIKMNRPIASGKVSVAKAVFLALINVVACFGINFIIYKMTGNYLSSIYLIVYLVINVAYSIKLKEIPLVDVAIIVCGFLIRVLYGASIAYITVSNWLLLTITAISFYLALGKRRNEVKKSGAKSRKVLEHYTLEFLDKNMYLCLTLAITFYSLWCFQSENSYLIWTVPLVIITCMKYNMVIEQDNFGDPTEVIYSNKAILILLVIIALTLLVMLYF